MNLSCTNKTIKYLMFVFNFVFVITGIIILGVGVSVKTYYNKYDEFLDGKYFSLPNMLIATGSLIFFISFLGCYGAMRENWQMLMAFSVLLAIIFIFELSVGIAGYVLRDKTSKYLEDELTESMAKYQNFSSTSGMWDAIQEEFECCGVFGPGDWNRTFENYSLPISCCPQRSGTVGAFYCNSYSVTNVTTPATTPTTPTTPSTPSTSTTLEPPSDEENTASNSSTTNTTTLTDNAQSPEKPPTDGVQSESININAQPALLAGQTEDNSTTTTGETTFSTNATEEATETTEQTTETTEAAIETTETTDPTDTTETTDSTTDLTPSETTPSTTQTQTVTSPETTSSTVTNVPTSTAYPPSSSDPYTTGCEAAFGNFVKSHAVDIGAVGIALAVIQLVGIFFSFHLARQLKNGYYST